MRGRQSARKARYGAASRSVRWSIRRDGRRARVPLVHVNLLQVECDTVHCTTRSGARQAACLSDQSSIGRRRRAERRMGRPGRENGTPGRAGADGDRGTGSQRRLHARAWRSAPDSWARLGSGPTGLQAPKEVVITRIGGVEPPGAADRAAGARPRRSQPRTRAVRPAEWSSSSRRPPARCDVPLRQWRRSGC